MRESMEIYPRTAAERAMKLQEVLLRATAGKIKWWQAAELIGISERQMRRWRKRFEAQGHQGLLDRRQRKPSSRRVPKAQAEEVLSLYRDRYFDLNVRHFHEKLGEEHQIGLSYTWVKQALQAAGLDRGAHFRYTPKSGGKVDCERPTQVGRAMKELGVHMIPAYSPQARGRSERNFSTWQGRLRWSCDCVGSEHWRGPTTLNKHYIAEFNRRFTVPAAQRGTAFISCRHRNLERIFTQRFERTVDRDNTVSFYNLIMQLERAEWRPTQAGCKVIIHQHLDQTLTLMIAGHRVEHYSAEGKLLTPLTNKEIKARGKDVERKSPKTDFPSQLANPAHYAGFGLSHRLYGY